MSPSGTQGCIHERKPIRLHMDLQQQHAMRMSKLLPNGRSLMVPCDHGASDYPVLGLEDMDSVYSSLSEGGANAVIAQKGVVSHLSGMAGTNLIAHLSVSTVHAGHHSDDKVLVGNVEEALARGAIAVSVQINVGSEHESAMIERMGIISTQCQKLAVPLLGMMYARGPNLKTEGDPTKGVAHAVRLGWELGCDIVKTSWTGSIESFEIVTAAVPIPVLIAGGEREGEPDSLLRMVKQSMLAGGAGICMGRQIFSHPEPEKMTRALHDVIHLGKGPSQAAEDL